MIEKFNIKKGEKDKSVFRRLEKKYKKASPIGRWAIFSHIIYYICSRIEEQYGYVNANSGVILAQRIRDWELYYRQLFSIKYEVVQDIDNIVRYDTEEQKYSIPPYTFKEILAQIAPSSHTRELFECFKWDYDKSLFPKPSKTNTLQEIVIEGIERTIYITLEPVNNICIGAEFKNILPINYGKIDFNGNYKEYKKKINNIFWEVVEIQNNIVTLEGEHNNDIIFSQQKINQIRSKNFVSI